MKYLAEFFRVFRLGGKLTNRSQACVLYSITALMLAVTSSGMCVMNIMRKFYVMAVITALLTVALLFCAYLSGIRKQTFLASLIEAFCLVTVFSYFAVSGQNHGFAILWIMLIPLISTGVMDLRFGIGASLYFLLLIFALFYTPLRGYMASYYSATFIERFPVLYLCNCVISLFLVLQKEFYSRKLQLKSNTDDLTGVFNRSYFTHFILCAPVSSQGNTCVMLIDLNGLKAVNDTFGHQAGDELICAVPLCCKEVIPSDFTLCRVGGDEFVLIIHQPEEEIAALVDAIKKKGQNWHGIHSKGCQVSIGWASSSVYPGDTMNELYRTADAMMYRDKAAYYQQQEKRQRMSTPQHFKADAK